MSSLCFRSRRRRDERRQRTLPKRTECAVTSFWGQIVPAVTLLYSRIDHAEDMQIFDTHQQMEKPVVVEVEPFQLFVANYSDGGV